jgi:uncharacterized membrane protein YphA (DoxX/SURF4 family)
MRSTVLAVAALSLLRIVVGMHFFLEGLSHLRDPSWSSVGFRKAAVGPLAEWYRSELPQTGDWSGTLGRVDGRDAREAAEDWQRSVRAGWEATLARREKVAPLAPDQQTAAKTALDAAAAALDAAVASWGEDLADYRLQVARLRSAEVQPAAAEIPFARDRVAKQRRELAGKVAGWSREADAIGVKLVADWDASLSREQLNKVAATKEPSKLWKADRFVAWALVTIGACLVVGFLVKFNAVGGALFLASVVAAQPFWVPGAIATYDQWVEMAALLVIACMPVGGWSGLDYFLTSCCASWCGRNPLKVRG